nr:replication initiator protein [Jatropha leaf curl virus]
MKMGNLICTCSSSLKANTSAKISDSSTWYPQRGQHISIRTFRELNPAPTSSPTSIRTEIHSTGDFNAEFMGAQRDWQSNTKYGKPVQIKGGIPTIFLCNPGPNSSYKEFLDEDKNAALKNWAIKNVIFVFLSEPLYSSSASQDFRLRERQSPYSADQGSTQGS